MNYDLVLALMFLNSLECAICMYCDLHSKLPGVSDSLFQIYVAIGVKASTSN